MSVVNLLSQNNSKNLINVALVEQEFVQKKFDSQLCLVKSFRNMCQIREDEHFKLPKKHVSTKDKGHPTLIKLDIWKQPKVALCFQVQMMLSGNQRPNITPLLLSFIGLEGEKYPDYPHLLAILPCPFCCRLFEPTWDCKFVSCKHAYHYWCVICQFYSSTKCLFEGCEQEMHLDRWVLSTINKLSLVEDAIPGID